LTVADPWTLIPADEFRSRQDRLRAAATASGLDGVVVWSRGGGFLDMAADVLYMTNHYSQQPYIGDEAGVGSARSHGVCVIPVDGPVTVIVDIPWWRRDLVVADDVRATIDVEGGAAKAVRDAGLAGARIGLVGASYMSAAAYLGFTAKLPHADFKRMDTLVEDLRIIKSPAEQHVIRRAATLGNETVEALIGAVVEGATEAEAQATAAHVLIAGGGVLYDAACSSGAWAHDFTHGRLPSAVSTRRFEKGDMFHVDCYGSYGGYFFDFARSRCVGDEPNHAQRDLLEAVIEGVDTVCAAIKPGVTAAEAFRVGEAWMANSATVKGLPVEEPVMEGFPAFGHGLGLMWEGPWLMADVKTAFEPGMYIAVEILLGHPSIGGAMFEHNGLVTDSGFEILTTARSRWW
jgi:Xaa-Pro aminopeptidase